MIDPVRIGLSLGLSALVGGLGYWRRSLTAGGWLGAILVGTATAGLGGWLWGALVVVFFITSSALSHWRAGAKEARLGGSAAKGGRRDLAQTLANGGVPALLALAYALLPHPAFVAAAIGSLAAVTADTWATEIGGLSRSAPRLITTGRPVAAGTSGGISAIGTAATVAGALGIGGAALVLSRLLGATAELWMLPAGLAGGVGGAMLDSLLGATAQRVQWCPRCQVETEQRLHRCGTVTEYRRGLRWLDNDLVNALAASAGAALGALVWLLAGR